jgi:exopolyphosphatase/guanosine-5'-triphosphate,3'-diphosphate pyrophosphatase
VRVAVCDIGTNSTRLLVADVEEGRVRALQRQVVVTGLGAGVDAGGNLAEAGVARTLEVLASYAAAARAAGAATLRVVATSAVRDAADREEFLDRAEAALGVRPEVIDGEREATLAFAGVVGAVEGPAPHLVIDVGGGSTEFVSGPGFVRSIDLGSRRITERFLAGHPAGRQALAAARQAAAEAFGALGLPGRPETVIGTGGTYTALAGISLGLAAYERERVHGSVLSLAALDRLADRLAGLGLEQIAALPSLDPARAPVLLGGTVVGAEALRRSGRTDLVVSEADLLDGLALE